MSDRCFCGVQERFAYRNALDMLGAPAGQLN